MPYRKGPGTSLPQLSLIYSVSNHPKNLHDLQAIRAGTQKMTILISDIKKVPELVLLFLSRHAACNTVGPRYANQEMWRQGL